MRVGNSFTNSLLRSRSALTGASSSGTLSRVVIEDSLEAARPGFQQSFMIDDNTVFDACSWSDNVATTGCTVEHAIRNMQCWAFFMRTLSNMHLKEDSFMAVPARTQKQGTQIVVVDGESWSVCDSVPCLGLTLTGTGDDSTDRRRMMSSISRVVWKFSKSLCNPLAPVSARFRLWRSLCTGITDYFLAGFYPSVSHATNMERQFNKLSFRVLRLRP